MVIAILRPRSEPSASCSPEILFRTGACWATHAILRCPSGASEGSLTIESRIMSLLPCMSHCGPDSGSVSSSRVYNSVHRNALVPVLTLESRDRREPQIQNHGRLGELRDYPGDLAALRPDHAPSLEALSFEALGPAFLPGNGGQRTAHDLLPLRIQRRPPPRDAHTTLRGIPDAPARRPEILPAPRSRLYALRHCLHRTARSGMNLGWSAFQVCSG